MSSKMSSPGGLLTLPPGYEYIKIIQISDTVMCITCPTQVPLYFDMQELAPWCLVMPPNFLPVACMRWH